MVEPTTKYDKMVMLGDKKLPAMLDTGSGVTCVREEHVKGIGVQPQSCNMVLRGFGGRTVQIKQKIPVTLTVDDVAFDVECMIVPKWAQDAAVLVGRDILGRDDVEFVKTSRTCTVRRIQSGQTEGRDDTWSRDGGQASILTVEAVNMDQQVYAVADGQKMEPIQENDVDFRGKSVSVESFLRLLNNYRACFSKNMSELGKAKGVTMTISLKDDKPVYSKPRRYEYSREAVIKQMIQELLDARIIVESDSPYSSRIVLVPKKENGFRMAVDYRLLNEKTVKDRFPLPNIEYCLNKLAGCVVFITVDLFSGYYQIPIDPQSQRYTAFSTADNHFHFLRMPFGLVNGSAVFQRAINKLMRRIKEDGVLAYMDDIVLGGETEEAVMVKFEVLLQQLQEVGFTINLKKSQFFVERLEFLGFEVSAEGVRPGNRKTRAVEEFPMPTSTRNVQQFLGLTGFFRRFVKGYCFIAAPLSQLMRGEADFVWASEHRQAFDRLKRELVQRPLLMLYGNDLDMPIEVHTDASSIGLAGILLGRTNEGCRPISYFSRKTSASEAKFSSYELEVLAVVASVERFRQYVLGRPFLVVTDCVAVTQTFAKREMCPRIARWLLKLQEYDVSFEHRKGEQMRHADALSRNPVEPAEEMQPVLHDIMRIEIDTDDFLVTMQRQDPKLVEIAGLLEQEPQSGQSRGVHRLFKLSRGRLFRRTEAGDRWVVPVRVRWRILKTCHDDMGHMAEEKVLQAVKRHFWFEGMAEYVKEYIRACPKCIYFKPKSGRQEGLLNPIPKRPVPFDTVHLDHLGPFIPSKKGNTYLIVATDAFTKFVVMKPVRTTRTVPVIEFVNAITAVFGNPARVITDRGTAFTSRDFGQYCRESGIEHVLVAVGSARANGQVERSNRTILTAVRSSIDDDDRTWDETTRQVQWAINSMPNSTTGIAPNRLVFAYTPRDILRNEVILALQEEIGDGDADVGDLTRRAHVNISKRQRLQKANFDARRKAAEQYLVGDMVLVENDLTATGGSRKLMPRFKGPYMVTRVLGNDRYEIQDVPGAPRKQMAAKTVFAADRMKRWCKLVELEFEMDQVEDRDDGLEGVAELFR
jgi:transposase InsO family protein